MDYFTAGETWIITLGITFFLMIMPWLPPRKPGPAAEVHLDHCNGCEQCADDCPFDAITVQARTDGAKFENEVKVNPDLCASCGICVGSCPSSNPFRSKNDLLVTGIDMPNNPINSIRDEVDNALAKLEGDNKIIVMGCENALDFSKFEASNKHVVSLFCIGMMPATLVEYALSHGADGVFISGCRTGDCFFRYGNVWMDERFAGDRQPILRKRADRSRIKVFRAAETDRKALHKELAEFEKYILALNEKEKAEQQESDNA